MNNIRPAVTLISCTPNAEKLVACAAKLCYSPSTIEQTQSKLTPENVQKFVTMLASIGHESPLEHISFTFGIEGVSRCLLAQITRHRIASYSVQSQRYVEGSNFGYVIPPEIENLPKAKELFLESLKNARECYLQLTNILLENHKSVLIKSGENPENAKKIAQKQSIEDARYILPGACDTKIICTFNARSLLNFFEHRCCNRAQWEIRNVATQMLKLVLKEAPSVFKFAGPGCVHSACPEGKMSCGKAKSVKEFFRSLSQNNI